MEVLGLMYYEVYGFKGSVKKYGVQDISPSTRLFTQFAANGQANRFLFLF